MKIKQYKQAMALLLSVAVIVSFSALSVVTLSRSVSESKFAQRYLKSTQTFWAAEAGVEEARHQLDQDWYDTGGIEGNLGGTVYQVVISNTDGEGNPLPATQVRLSSSGTVDNISRSIEAIVENVPAGAFQYGVVGAGLVEIRGGANVHGDVFVIGDVEVQAGASVLKEDDSVFPSIPDAYNANVYYTGSNLGVSGVVEGSVIQVTETPTMPTFDWDDIEANADYVSFGPTVLSGTLADGVYYINGDVQLDNVQLGQGAIIAEGKAEIIGVTTLDSPEPGLPVLANQTGTLEVDGTAELKGLVYTGGTGMELRTGSSMEVHGSIMTEDANVELKTDLGSLDIYHKTEYLMEHDGDSIVVSTWEDQQNPFKLQ